LIERNDSSLSGNDKYEGYCADLAKMMMMIGSAGSRTGEHVTTTHLAKMTTMIGSAGSRTGEHVTTTHLAKMTTMIALQVAVQVST